MKTIQESILKNTRTGKYLGKENLDEENALRLWQHGTFNHIAEDVNCQKIQVGDFVYDFCNKHKGVVKAVRGGMLDILCYFPIGEGSFEEYSVSCNYVIKLSKEFIKKVGLLV